MRFDIGVNAVAEGLFEALKSAPELLSGARMTPAMLVHEVAARDAILDWCEGRSNGFAHLPADVRALAAAFVTQFLHRLAVGDPAFVGATWSVPVAATLQEQAKCAVAQEIRGQQDPTPRSH